MVRIYSGALVLRFIHNSCLQNISEHKYKIQSSDSWSALVFRRVVPNEEAEYTCTTSNVLGIVIKECSLRV